jgi:hypothetical protein
LAAQVYWIAEWIEILAKSHFTAGIGQLTHAAQHIAKEIIRRSTIGLLGDPSKQCESIWNKDLRFKRGNKTLKMIETFDSVRLRHSRIPQ